MTSQISARERIATEAWGKIADELSRLVYTQEWIGEEYPVRDTTDRIIQIVREALTDKEAVGTLAQSIADGSGQAVRDSIAREYIGAMLDTTLGEEAGDGN